MLIESGTNYQWLRSHAAAIGLAASLLVGTVGCTGSETRTPTSEATTIPSTTTPSTFPLQAQAEQCPTVTAQTVADTEAILNRPQDARFATALKEHSQNSYADQIEAQTAVAQSYGLHLHLNEARPLLSKHLISGKGYKPVPFMDYFDDTANFLSLFGVRVSLGDTAMTIGGVRPLNESEQSEAAGETIFGAVTSFEEYPTEFIHEVGLKTIYLVHIDDPEHAGFATTKKGQGTIYVDPTKFPSEGFQHELYHLLDAAECGSNGASSDQAFNSLNPSPNIYQDHVGYLSRASFADYSEQSMPLLLDAKRNGQTDAVSKLQAIDDALQTSVVTQTDYGFTNVIEDKAEDGKHIFESYDYSALLGMHSPVLMAKTKLLMERLDQFDPNVMHYFGAIADKTPRNN